MFPAASISLLHAYQVAYEGFIDDKLSARDAMSRQALREVRELLFSVKLPAGRRVETLCEHGQPEVLLNDLMLTGEADLVVVGTRGRGKVAALLLGSVATEPLSTLPGDVMIVPHAA